MLILWLKFDVKKSYALPIDGIFCFLIHFAISTVGDIMLKGR